jgi:hypothetical protein
MPHNGPRGSPLTEKRQGSPAITTAAATLAPAATRTGCPFTVMEKPSLINRTQPRRAARSESPHRSRIHSELPPLSRKIAAARAKPVTVTPQAPHQTFTCRDVGLSAKME